MRNRLVHLALLQYHSLARWCTRVPGPVGLPELSQEQLPNEPMEPEPLASTIDPNHESVSAPHATHHARRVRTLGDGVRQRRCELLDNRDVPHELAISGLRLSRSSAFR